MALAVEPLISDEVAVMRRGEVVELGDVDQIYDDPQHEYTKLLLSSAARLAPVTDRQPMASITTPSPASIAP